MRFNFIFDFAFEFYIQFLALLDIALGYMISSNFMIGNTGYLTFEMACETSLDMT